MFARLSNHWTRCLIPVSHEGGSVIHSSSIDNWHRIKIMHSIASDLYQITRESKFRNRKNDMSEGFYFDAKAFDTMQKESCIVEMIMAWCAITLESQVNHAIAATESDVKKVINAIEYPKGATPIKGARSELAKKLSILSGFDSAGAALISFANDISDVRNEIVHDKPFELLDRGDGDVEVRHFRRRGNSDGKRYMFEDLCKHYEKCQKICDFIELYYIYDFPVGERVHFKF